MSPHKSPRAHGLSRRHLLQGTAGLGALGSLGAPMQALAQSTSQKKLLIVLARGAWDTTICLDPKLGLERIDGADVDEDPSNPDDRELVPAGDLRVGINSFKRPNVTAFFESWASRTSVVNGISMSTIAHDAARQRILCGSRTPGSPDVGAMAGAGIENDASVGYIDFTGQGFLGPLAASSGMVGSRGQLKALVDPDSPLAIPSGSPSPPAFVPSAASRSAVDAFLADRAERARQTFAGDTRSNTAIDDYLESRARAALLREEGADLLDFRIGQPLSVGQQFTVGLGMLQNDLCNSILVDSGLPWDTHTDNVDQHDHFNALFGGLSLAAELLDGAGMLESTVVCVLSEFGRTPRLNRDLGKDHWPYASALLFGGGVGGGRTLGGTDDDLIGQAVDLNTGEVVDCADGPDCAVPDYANLVAGILALLDVDSEAWLPGVEAYHGLAV